MDTEDDEVQVAEAGEGDDRVGDDIGGGGAQETSPPLSMSSGNPIKAGKVGQEKQIATASMMTKALKVYGEGLNVREDAKKLLKTMAMQILRDLLGKPQLSGFFDVHKIQEAIHHWIPEQGDLGRDMRFAPLLLQLSNEVHYFSDVSGLTKNCFRNQQIKPDEKMKPTRTGDNGLIAQIKALHPSLPTGNLTKPDVDYVESIIGCFCKVIWQQY